jgi:hypothetical protein
MYKQTEKENVPLVSLAKITLKINYSLQFCILLFFSLRFSSCVISIFRTN